LIFSSVACSNSLSGVFKGFKIAFPFAISITSDVSTRPSNRIRFCTMTSLSILKNDITSLASQLQKLLKVIRHSDPTAEEMKHLLHDKYQHHLSTVAGQAKQQFLWDEFRKYLQDLIRPENIDISAENAAAIRRKLISDFENQFIARQILNEFSPPDPKEIRRQQEIRKRRKAYLARKAEAEKSYTKEEIMEMVQTTRQQRQARSELKNLIEAIRKLDPQKIENKINQFIKPNH